MEIRDDLEDFYEAAWRTWDLLGEREAWEAVAADGLQEAR
ncbi:hypothetical protein GCM10027425_04720 [Alteromonas gracilis]